MEKEWKRVFRLASKPAKLIAIALQKNRALPANPAMLL